jgi:protein dithiol oxidoreductase (disulfide-forming)
MTRFVLGSIALLFSAVISAQAKPIPEEGRDYIRLETPQPTNSGDKIEVIEMFSYGCIHCLEFEPFIQAWQKKMPPEVAFQLMPATLGNPSWEALARAFYVGEVLGLPKNKTHAPIFHRNFQEGKAPMAGLDEIATFFESNFGVKSATFQQTANSFAVETKVRRADDISRRFRVAGTPTLIVNGKYVFTVTLRGPAGLQHMIDTLDYLVDKEIAAKAGAKGG